MLEHPFVHRKKVLLKHLHRKRTDGGMSPIDSSIIALFPELVMVENFSYQQEVVAKFKPSLFMQGDRTEEIVKSAIDILQQLELWDIDEEETTETFIVEDLDPIKGSMFLATHYYRFGMFKWFWIMYEISKSVENPDLLQFAGDILYFQRSDMKVVRTYYEKCISRMKNVVKAQQLWTKLSVLYSLRKEFDTAYEILKYSFTLIDNISDGDLKKCRFVEAINAECLILYRLGKVKKAINQLKIGQQIISGCIHPEAERLRRLIQTNYSRLVGVIEN